MSSKEQSETAEHARLAAANDGDEAWRRWGPYVSERAWGTVREDYSADGDAWSYFPHDQARSRAYRWSEDGLAGICDDHQRICFALALWNGNDPILKERAFGLSGAQGNHGEDVKEYYYYLDSTPTHSYMKYLYKYPHAAFPYAELIAENGRRGKLEPEYELMDTGIFDESRYFDVFVEYAKAAPEDIFIQRPHGSTFCLRSGFAIRGPGMTTRPGLTSHWCVTRRPISSCITNIWVTVISFSSARPKYCSPRMKQTPSASTASRMPHPMSRMHSTNTSSTTGSTRSTPPKKAPKVRRTIRS
jgi:hypothetical protein